MIITQAKCDFFVHVKPHTCTDTHTLLERENNTSYYRPTIHFIGLHFFLPKIYMVSCAIRHRHKQSQFVSLPDVVSLERFSFFLQAAMHPAVASMRALLLPPQLIHFHYDLTIVQLTLVKNINNICMYSKIHICILIKRKAQMQYVVATHSHSAILSRIKYIQHFSQKKIILLLQLCLSISAAKVQVFSPFMIKTVIA